MRTKVPPVRNANGFSKDKFRIDLAAGTVTCPAHHTVAIRAGPCHRVARFGALCGSCPLLAQCTKARRGLTWACRQCGAVVYAPPIEPDFGDLENQLIGDYLDAIANQAAAEAEVAKWTDRRAYALAQLHAHGWSLPRIAGVTYLSRTRVQQLVERGRDVEIT